MQLHVLSAIQQLHRYAIVFRNVLASDQRAVVEEATYNQLICYGELPVDQDTARHIWQCSGMAV